MDIQVSSMIIYSRAVLDGELGVVNLILDGWWDTEKRLTRFICKVFNGKTGLKKIGQ